MEKYLLALNTHPKIGSQTVKKLLHHFNSPDKIWSASFSQIEQKIDLKTASYVKEVKENTNPELVVDNLRKYNIGYLTFKDKNYPKLLKEIPDCPAILYIKGNLLALTNNPIGVVGSRKYSSYGQRHAYSFSKELASSGFSIISGLALGIDAFAHRAALDVGGLTVGVLGCGLDRIYPISNYNLAKDILDHNGAIISEFPLGTPPLKQNFPARNRIIAGLSLGTIVIEAAEKSGALITAYEALDYNREIFALPGNIDSINSVGTNKLIQSGAKLVLSPLDVISELNIEVKQNIRKAKEDFAKTEEEIKILSALESGEKSIDEIIEITKLNVNIVNSALTLLEIKGQISNLGGGRFQNI